MHFIKVVDTSVDGDSNTAEGRSQEKIVAYAQWYGPNYDAVAAEKKEGGDQEVPWPTEEGGQELLALFFGGAHERHMKIMGHRPHCCKFVVVFFFSILSKQFCKTDPVARTENSSPCHLYAARVSGQRHRLSACAVGLRPGGPRGRRGVPSGCAAGNLII